MPGCAKTVYIEDKHKRRFLQVIHQLTNNLSVNVGTLVKIYLSKICLAILFPKADAYRSLGLVQCRDGGNVAIYRMGYRYDFPKVQIANCYQCCFPSLCSKQYSPRLPARVHPHQFLPTLSNHIQSSKYLFHRLSQLYCAADSGRQCPALLQ
jgi:hypothetical protein